MHLAKRAISLLLPLAILATVVGTASPAASVTQAQVDAACADSRDAYEVYQRENGRYEAATEKFQLTSAELESTALRGNYLRSRVEERTGEVIDIRSRVQDRAVEMYVNASRSITDVLFATTSLGQLLAGRQFIATATERDIASLDRLAALRHDLNNLRGELKAEETKLRVLRDEQEIVKNELAEVVEVAQSSWHQLSDKCRELERERARELARRAALEAARKRGAAGGVGAAVTPGFRCPMDPGPTHFINDWGFPRSGGRTHKGTDLFAPHGQKVYAASDGSVLLGNGGLGGRSVWLMSDDGYAVYYAHLDAWAPGLGSGERVSRGTLLGYNGNSGNARGGSPHVHLQIHPGGRGSPPTNPFPTLANFGCR